MVLLHSLWTWVILSLVLISADSRLLLENNEFGEGVVENEFIVSFYKYMNHSEHADILHRILGETGWEIVARNNPAWFLPSDFSLIKIANKEHNFVNKLLETLQNCKEVRHVVPERRFVGILNEHEEQDVTEETEDGFELVNNQTGKRLTRDVQEGTYRRFYNYSEIRTYTGRKLHSQTPITELLNANFLWENQYTGTGVRVAIFDTGLRRQHSHFRNVKEILNWTSEEANGDGVGHGTFVAGVFNELLFTRKVIASQSECLGFAPDSDLYIFRVFTTQRVSYTSWFLDAFNYAIHKKIHVLNLSIGGPDFLDRPFVEKVWELSANNVIVVSAIGNDGPLYGTLNNPADQLDVIGVGGIDFNDHLSSFSSRGMTTWELPTGYGRVKPDLVAFGQNVEGSKIYSGCRTLSVASPVVAGAVALLASSLPENTRWDILNPASMKQILVDSADKLAVSHIFEQGSGKLNLLGAWERLTGYIPHVSAFPRELDLTECPYMWPYCAQPAYYSGMPLQVNLTLLNGMGVSGEFVGTPQFRPGPNGNLLEISYTYPDLLWPWTGWLGVHIQISKEGEEFEGNAEGLILFTVKSPPGPGETQDRISNVEIPLKIHITPTPHRSKRLLWDQYHNLRYPSGYFPRDALDIKEEPFDWNGDHVHTNFQSLFRHLRGLGYFVEVLGSPFTCFDASLYSTLLVVDPEEEFFPIEVKKLKRDIEEEGLNVIVIGDWYNVDIMKKIKFFDENTRQWWTPSTGGANIPALNDLLRSFNISFGDRVYHGDFESADKEKSSSYSSGTSLIAFPSGGSLLSFPLFDKSLEILTGKVDRYSTPIAGIFPTDPTLISQRSQGGTIITFGDSSCLDDANAKNPFSLGNCFWLLDDFLNFLRNKKMISQSQWTPISQPFRFGSSLPQRMEGNDLHKFSKVVGQSASCKKMDFGATNRSEEPVELVWGELSSMGYSHGSNGKFREKLMARRSSSPSEGRIIWPYIVIVILVGVMGGMMYLWRKEREQFRRAQQV